MNAAQPSYQELLQINQEQRLQIDQLKFELEQLKKAIYGSKSERFTQVDPHQANLFEDDQMASATIEEQERQITVKKKRKGKQPVRTKIPESLRREAVIVEPDVDTAQMRKIGDQISEKLESLLRTLKIP